MFFFLNVDNARPIGVDQIVSKSVGMLLWALDSNLSDASGASIDTSNQMPAHIDSRLPIIHRGKLQLRLIHSYKSRSTFTFLQQNSPNIYIYMYIYIYI